MHSLLVLYTLLVYGMQYSFTGIVVIIGILFSYLRFNSVVRLGHIIWAKGIFLFTGKRIKIRGLEQINRKRKHLIIANHTSIYDIPAIMNVVPQISWIGREYLTRIIGFGRLLKMNHYIAIEPGQPKRSRESIEQAIRKAEENMTICIFPEGSRTLNGQLGPFRKGFIRILRAARLDVLPITLNGFYTLKPKNRFVIDPRTHLEIVIHPVLKAEELCQLTDEEILKIAKDAIEKNYRYC